MVYGDSMTSGDYSSPLTGYQSYRGHLYQKLVADGFTAVDIIGTRSLATAAGGDTDHDGFPGEVIGPDPAEPNTLLSRLPGVLQVSPDPDIVVMAFGWNSVNWGQGWAADHYQGFVERMQELRPNARLILATLPPRQGEREEDTAVALPKWQALNERARALANARADDNLHLADLARAGFAASEFWDVIHWNDAGAQRAAEVIFQTIRANALITPP